MAIKINDDDDDNNNNHHHNNNNNNNNNNQIIIQFHEDANVVVESQDDVVMPEVDETVMLEDVDVTDVENEELSQETKAIIDEVKEMCRNKSMAEGGTFKKANFKRQNEATQKKISH